MITSWPVMVVLVCIFIMFYLTYDLMIKIGRKLGVYNPEEWRLRTIINKFQEMRVKSTRKRLSKAEREFRNEMKRYN